MGCPLATYIKEGREEVAGPRGRARCGENYQDSPIQVGFPSLFLFLVGEGGKEKEERRKGGAPQP